MGYETRGARGGSGCATLLGNLLLMLTGGIILIALLAMFGVWYAGDRFLEGVEAIVNPPPATPEVDTRSVVVRQIRDASELTTTVFAMETVSDASVDRTVGSFVVGSTKLLYIAYGEVRAGVDLSDIGPEDVDVEGDAIRVRLPPPEILDSKIDVSRSRVYDYDRGFLSLGPEAPELQSVAEQEALGQIILGACDSGVLTEAADKAQLAVQQLLSVSGYQEIVVEVQEPLPTACPVGE